MNIHKYIQTASWKWSFLLYGTIDWTILLSHALSPCWTLITLCCKFAKNGILVAMTRATLYLSSFKPGIRLRWAAERHWSQVPWAIEVENIHTWTVTEVKTMWNLKHHVMCHQTGDAISSLNSNLDSIYRQSGSKDIQPRSHHCIAAWPRFSQLCFRLVQLLITLLHRHGVYCLGLGLPFLSFQQRWRMWPASLRAMKTTEMQQIWIPHTYSFCALRRPGLPKLSHLAQNLGHTVSVKDT